VVEFNDVPSLEAALAPAMSACVLTEPALTNVGMCCRSGDFPRGVAQCHGQARTLLVIDETHTISTGYGGLYALA